MTVLIDSSGWIEYFSKGRNAERFAAYVEKATPSHCITPTIVLYEVQKGVKRACGEEIADKAAAYLFTSTTLIELSAELALEAANQSMKLGLTMADAIIKTTADAYQATIVTGDKDFKGLSNVILIEK